jgi:ATP-dependent exoDNAse (exonuclease V) beta subunit
LTPEANTPSSMKNHEAVDLPELKLSTYSYADNLLVDFDLNEADRGTLIHRCYEVLEFCPDRESLSNACDFEFTSEQEQGLRHQVAKFNSWLNKTLSPISCAAEIPFLTQNEAGSVISGIIDLVVETEEGFWIIDHKSDRTDDRKGRFAQYMQQLDAYATAIKKARPEKPVLGVGINWASFGEVMLMENLI